MTSAPSQTTATHLGHAYFAAIGRGDIAAALACFAPDAAFSAPMGPLPFPDGVRAMLGGYLEAFPGSRFEVERVVAAGDAAALEGCWLGRHTGPMHLPDGTVLPPTQRDVKIPFVTLIEARAGKIGAHRGYWDLAGFMAQLGLGA